jgi:hypothetical protein
MTGLLILSFGIVLYILFANYPRETPSLPPYLAVKKADKFPTMVWRINTLNNKAVVPFPSVSTCKFSKNFDYCWPSDNWNSHRDINRGFYYMEPISIVTKAWYNITIDANKWTNTTLPDMVCVEVAPFDKFTQFYEITVENRNNDPAKFVKLCSGESVTFFLRASSTKLLDNYWNIYDYTVVKIPEDQHGGFINFLVSSDYIDPSILYVKQDAPNSAPFYQIVSYALFCTFIFLLLFSPAIWWYKSKPINENEALIHQST